jgi:hypothetical protein
MDEQRLLDKLRRIEALHAGAKTDGERLAAGEARRRILARLKEVRASDPPVEYRFTIHDPWQRRLFSALLRRYELRPYRYHRQRRTTIMVQVPKRFVDETLWPEFEALSETLQEFLQDVTSRVISQAIHGDLSDADEVEEPRALPG